MSICAKCENIKNCGTVNRYLRDYGKTEILKKLNAENKECKDFSFIAISGTVLRDKILELTNLSTKLKTSLKQVKNKKK